MITDLNEEVEREVEIGLGDDELLVGTFRIAYEYESCECSSEVGDQTVIERWQEIHIKEIELLNYYYCDDAGNEIAKQISHSDKSELIRTAKQEFYDSQF